jgi:hypothetical protein
MVHYTSTWYYWVSGLHPSSSSVNKTQCYRIGSNSILRYKGGKAPTPFGTLEEAI